VNAAAHVTLRSGSIFIFYTQNVKYKTPSAKGRRRFVFQKKTKAFFTTE
jgi:hypothetical protein